MPPHHRLSLPSEVFFSSSFFFSIAAANAEASTQTKLALCPPPLRSLSADAFACSPCHPTTTTIPCSPSNLSLKTSFLPFITFSPPLLTSAPASRGLAMASLESHVIFIENFCLGGGGEGGREMNIKTLILPQLQGQRSP